MARKKKAARRDPNVEDSKILSAKVTDLPEEAQLNVLKKLWILWGYSKIQGEVIILLCRQVS